MDIFPVDLPAGLGEPDHAVPILLHLLSNSDGMADSYYNDYPGLTVLYKKSVYGGTGCLSIETDSPILHC